MTEQPTNVTRQAVQGTLWAYLSFVSVKGLSLVSTIILTNLVLPGEYGLVGYCLLALQFLDILNNFGMDVALVSRRDRIEEAANAAFYISILMGLLLFAAAWLSAPLIAVFFKEPPIVELFRLLAITLPIGALGMVPSAMLKRGLRFKAKLIPDVMSNLVKGIVTIGLAWFGFGAWSLIWGQIGSVITVVALLWLLARWRPTLRLDRQVSREMLGFGSHIVVVGLLGAVLANVDYLLVGRILGSTMLGYYLLAYKIPELIIRNTNDVVAKVAHPLLSQLQSDLQQMRTIYFGYLRYISLFTIPAGVGLALITPAFITIFTPRWAPATETMQVISIALGISSIGYVPGVLYKAISRPEILNRLSWVKAPITVAILWYCTRWGILGVAFGQLAVALLNVTLDCLVVSRVVRFGLDELIRSLAPALTATTVMALTILLLEAMLAPGAIVALIVYPLVGVAAYVAILSFTSHDEVLRARRALRSALSRT